MSFVGVNSVIGTVGGSDQQDWITVHVPTGMKFTNLVLASYQSTDAQGFTGFQGGATFVGNAGSAAPYWGYAHFGTGAKNGSLPPTNLVGADLLPLMADTTNVAIGAQGFTIPLQSGDYAFLIQQLGASTSYQFDFQVVPEPSSLCLLGLVMSGAAGGRAFRKWRAKP